MLRKQVQALRAAATSAATLRASSASASASAANLKFVSNKSAAPVLGGRFFSTKIDSFNNGSNSVYVEQMYDAWLKDPKRYDQISFTYIFLLVIPFYGQCPHLLECLFF
jgi:hypothetical protein